LYFCHIAILKKDVHKCNQ